MSERATQRAHAASALDDKQRRFVCRCVSVQLALPPGNCASAATTAAATTTASWPVTLDDSQGAALVLVRVEGVNSCPDGLDLPVSLVVAIRSAVRCALRTGSGVVEVVAKSSRVSG
jgi:hypothetical protein